MNKLIIVFGIAALLGTVLIPSNKCNNKVQQRNCVPDTTTAIKIAEETWLPIYGDDVLTQKPYRVTLVDDSIWIVKGTLHEEFGGVAYIEINKHNCKVLKVTHGK